MIWVNSGCKSQNGWSHGKPKTAAWFFPAPRLLIFKFFHSFIHHRAFKLNLDGGTYELKLLKGTSYTNALS